MTNSTFSEKDILGDALATAKFATDNYNTFSNECAHENVRSTFMKLLNEEHEIQNEVFQTMSSKGFYPTPEAETTKVDAAKQQYSMLIHGHTAEIQHITIMKSLVGTVPILYRNVSIRVLE